MSAMITKENVILYAKNVRKNPLTLVGLVGIGLFIAVTGGVTLYRWHINRQQRLAQLAFSESLEVYHQAWAVDLTPELEAEKLGLWEEVELAFKSAHEQNGSSTFGPFYVAFEAQAMAHQGKIQEAVDLLDKAMRALTKYPQFYYLFKTTQALILFEDKDQQKAIDALKAVAMDEKNPMAAMAYFYLGEYYLYQQDQAHAKEAFNKAITTQGNDVRFASPWMALAQAKVQQLG